MGGETNYCVRKIQMLREFQEPGDWRTTVLASWAESTLQTYGRHLRHLATSQYAAFGEGPIKVLPGYLASRAATDKTSSNMQQIISACRLCEELALVNEFVPPSIWRMVRGKDRLAGRGSSHGWGSLEVLECMAKRASTAEDKIMVALAVSSIIYCPRISEAASIRSINLVQDEAFVRFYNFKCKDKWIKRPAGMCAESSDSSGYRWRSRADEWPYRCSAAVRGSWVRPWRGCSPTRSFGTPGGTAGGEHARRCSRVRVEVCANSWPRGDGVRYESRGSMWQSGMPCHGHAGWYRGPKWRWVQRPSGGMGLSHSEHGNCGRNDRSCAMTMTAGRRRVPTRKELENVFLDAQMLHPLRMSDKESNVRLKCVQRNEKFHHRSNEDVRRELRTRSFTRGRPLWSSATRKSPSRSRSLGWLGQQIRYKRPKRAPIGSSGPRGGVGKLQELAAKAKSAAHQSGPGVVTHRLTCPGRPRPANVTDSGPCFGGPLAVFGFHLIGHLEICGGPCLRCSLWFSCWPDEKVGLELLRSCCLQCLTCRRLIF